MKKGVIELNITIVCERFDQSTLFRQPWRRIYEIALRAAKQSISVTVVSDKSSNQPEIEEIAGIHINRISHLALAWLIKKKELLETITRNSPDVVIWYGTLLSALYLTQLKSIKKPLVWDIERETGGLGLFRRMSFQEVIHPHHVFLLLQEAFMSILPKFVIRSVANSALISRIIVPGRYLKESLCKLGVEPHKISISSLAVEIDRIENPDAFHADDGYAGKSCNKTGGLVVTYMGSPCTLRGTDTVIRSTPKIANKYKNIKISILSRRNPRTPKIARDYLASEERFLKKLARKLRVEDSVEITCGALSRSDLRRYILDSDVIVLPFKMVISEPPLSVLEAMGLGKVVVTTDIGILAEIIGKDRGILIEPGDSDALAQAIIFLCEHPCTREKIGNNAKCFVDGLSGWDDLALEFVDLLKEVAVEV